jgi:hypothetical protein
LHGLDGVRCFADAHAVEADAAAGFAAGIFLLGAELAE